MPGSHSHRQLGILSVALITYFNVSGGPWGSEPVLAACGPFVGILAVLLFPWVWCLPLALTFAELFTAFPTDGSFCKWVGVAFGRPMGFHVGYWSWVSGVLIVYAMPLIEPANWFVIRQDRDWGRLLSALYWNYSGFDAAGAYAGEIQSPKTTYPKAMVLTVVMIAFTYIIPFIAIAGADMPHYTTWDDGSYSVIAQMIGGTWLCIWVLISSVFGNLGLYVAEMAKDGFQLAGMADSGLAPPYFAQRHPDTGVPRRAILLAFFIIVFMGMFDFDTILGIDNFLSALSSLVEMSAAVRMRFSHPEIERPYRVNLSDKSLVMAMMLPFTLGIFIMMNELTKSWTSFLLNVIALTLGYLIQKYIERHPYHKYAEIIGAPLHLTDLSEDL
ncbi:Wall-associated receptor kinase [Phytophthora nicotianae]|uniref:Wall-associated receptor kinase n=1 Tax=Phytophthora nicotianae TaxID=4792 RepID=A0A0W8CYQ4_PHYNI|nr:Wall-associated receptor kinase [Phytophthora nicotianae]